MSLLKDAELKCAKELESMEFNFGRSLTEIELQAFKSGFFRGLAIGQMDIIKMIKDQIKGGGLKARKSITGASGKSNPVI